MSLNDDVFLISALDLLLFTALLVDFWEPERKCQNERE